MKNQELIAVTLRQISFGVLIGLASAIFTASICTAQSDEPIYGVGVKASWHILPVINEDIEQPVINQFDHFNAVLFCVRAFAQYKGRYPNSLQEVYDEGYILFRPRNFILGEPVNLNGPSVEGGLPGEIWIERDGKKVSLRYRYGPDDEWHMGRVDFTFFKTWDSYGSLKNDPFLNEYYSDETNRKLLALVDFLMFTIPMYEPQTPDDLLIAESWPFSFEGRNPVTGGPLNMGTNPGEYIIELKKHKDQTRLVYNVYGRDGNPIPSRHAMVEPNPHTSG